MEFRTGFPFCRSLTQIVFSLIACALVGFKLTVDDDDNEDDDDDDIDRIIEDDEAENDEGANKDEDNEEEDELPNSDALSPSVKRNQDEHSKRIQKKKRNIKVTGATQNRSFSLSWAGVE